MNEAIMCCRFNGYIATVTLSRFCGRNWYGLKLTWLAHVIVGKLHMCRDGTAWCGCVTRVAAGRKGPARVVAACATGPVGYTAAGRWGFLRVDTGYSGIRCGSIRVVTGLSGYYGLPITRLLKYTPPRRQTTFIVSITYRETPEWSSHT